MMTQLDLEAGVKGEIEIGKELLTVISYKLFSHFEAFLI